MCVYTLYMVYWCMYAVHKVKMVCSSVWSSCQKVQNKREYERRMKVMRNLKVPLAKKMKCRREANHIWFFLMDFTLQPLFLFLQSSVSRTKKTNFFVSGLVRTPETVLSISFVNKIGEHNTRIIGETSTQSNRHK